MVDVNLSSLGSGGGGAYDAIAYQLSKSAVADESVDGGWTLADLNEVFDRVCYFLDRNVNLTLKSATAVFDSAADSAAFAGSAELRARLEASTHLKGLGLASAELSQPAVG